jgi:hypothetical protein
MFVIHETLQKENEKWKNNAMTIYKISSYFIW